jgi:hypothetical protein
MTVRILEGAPTLRAKVWMARRAVKPATACMVDARHTTF